MQDHPDKPRSLPTVSLGCPPKQCTRLGLGGFHQLEISSEFVVEVIDAYIREGGNYIETARDYGNGASEEKIGRAIEGRREQLVLCSKTSAATADDLRRDLDLTLGALRTDHLDFYFYHCVDPDKLETITLPDGAQKAMIEAIDQKIVGGAGFSSHEPEVYLDALNRLDLSVILVWLNYLDNQNFPTIPNRVVPEARRIGVGVTAMKPLADGLLHASVDMAVAYCLGSGADVVVCGANRVQHVRQLANAVRKGPADANELRDILTAAPELGRYVCRRCGQCSDELMELFRFEGMLDRQMIDFMPRNPADHALRKTLSRWFDLAGAARDGFAHMGVDAEHLFSLAGEASCPYGIDLPRKARMAVTKMSGESPFFI